MKNTLYLIVLGLTLGCTSPQNPSINIAEEKEAIWNAVEEYAALMEQNKYEKALRTMFPPEYLVVNGKGYQTTYADTVVKESLQYINAYNIRYETFEPQPNPVIEIAQSGDMAYAIAQIKMVIVSTDSTGNEQREERQPTFFSSLKKVDGKWVIAVSSQHR